MSHNPDPAAAAATSAPPAAPTPPPVAPPPVAPSPPPFVPMPMPRALAYISASITIALTQGLAQGFLSTNIPQIAGDLGTTATQATWLMAAFLIPRASLPLILMKVRDQYGLRNFAEISIVIYLLVALLSFAILDLRSALLVQFFAGMASAPLSTLAFLYALEPLPPAWKMRLGLPLVMTCFTLGPLLARVISPRLMGDLGWQPLHLMTLGMAGIAMALVYLLPLKSLPRVKVIAPLDIVSFLLIAFGFGGLTVAFVMGATYWWTAVDWLGWTLALSVAALTITVMIELNRAKPLIDIRWLVTPAMLHFTVTLLLFRLILSEQSAGAPRMFQALGVTQGQLVGLFSVISVATIAGGAAVIPFMKPHLVPRLHVVALSLIAVGALMDSGSTIDTRPVQMMLSQAMIGFAGPFFMASAMMAGLLSALARGPAYLLSFIVVFISTQSLGGAMGSGLFSSLINDRQAMHLQVLREGLTAQDPLVIQQIALRSGAIAAQVADPALRKAQAVALMAQDVSNQAYVMAYNDVYFATFLLAAAALVALLLHMARDKMASRWPFTTSSEHSA